MTLTGPIPTNRISTISWKDGVMPRRPHLRVERREERRPQRGVVADEREDDQPEQEARLTPRNDPSEQRRGTLGRHAQTVAYGAHLIG